MEKSFVKVKQPIKEGTVKKLNWILLTKLDAQNNAKWWSHSIKPIYIIYVLQVVANHGKQGVRVLQFIAENMKWSDHKHYIFSWWQHLKWKPKFV